MDCDVAMDNESAVEQEEFVNETEEQNTKRCRLPRRQTVQSKKFCAKEERNASIKKVTAILQKSETERTPEEVKTLRDRADTVREVRSRWRKRDEAKKRLEEFEDPEEELDQKCQILATAIAQSQHLVVYTGAGISTSAKIPDYRGPNGIWTRLQQGKEIGDHDLSLAEPTYTHMALYELYRRSILKYVVSQNCDGLHLRSGLPRTVLSELHGNMYIEVCKSCKPHKEYWRLFDVTENTARYAHKTSRKCYSCNGPLVDTIVHFGERGKLQWPLNWKGACKNAEKATTILCLGSSLKVLKKYPWLWQMDKPVKKRPNLYIINLQWTPKDDFANVKINGKCDKVMERVMEYLGMKPPLYQRIKDPIYFHSTKLCELEHHTTTQPFLQELKVEKTENDIDIKTEDCTDPLKHDLKDDNVPNCDNPHLNSRNSVERLPHAQQADKPPSNSIFSIDKILASNNAELSLLTPSEPQTSTLPFNSLFLNPIVDYNNFLNQHLFNTYDFLCYSYPYQSSFIYSGLHSIINPIEIPEEDPLAMSETVKPACNFCDENYDSVSCLFYASSEPTFANQQFRFSKVENKEKPNICVCCDYTTEEEDIEEDFQEDSMDTKDGLQDKEAKNKIQAGWFGKGYRKGRYKKK